MAKIQIKYYIDKVNRFCIETRKITIIFNEKESQVKSTVCNTKPLSYNVFTTFNDYEIMFLDQTKQRIREEIENIEYTIDKKMHIFLSKSNILIPQSDYNYLFKVLNQLKEQWGELSNSEKEKLHLPLDDKQWILENIPYSYQSISEELKSDKDILDAYVNNIINNHLEGIKYIPKDFLNDTSFLNNLKTKMIKATEGNQCKSNFIIDADLLKNTKLFETFKEFVSDQYGYVNFNLNN